MKPIITFLMTIFLITSVVLAYPPTKKSATPSENQVSSKEKLVVLWTSGDADVAKKMVFMYTYNAKKQGWFKSVRLVVWGASTKLLSQDEQLQKYIGKMKEVGVELYACKACADMYGLSDLLTKLGIKVIYYGKPLTKHIKGDAKLVTF